VPPQMPSDSRILMAKLRHSPCTGHARQMATALAMTLGASENQQALSGRPEHSADLVQWCLEMASAVTDMGYGSARGATPLIGLIGLSTAAGGHTTVAGQPHPIARSLECS
jgi:hypothetical protein